MTSEYQYKVHPLLRAVGVISAVMIVVGGVTYAALQSQAILADNSISSATTGLLVDGSDVDTTPSESETGFNFANLAPGADYGTAKEFRLKNSGTAPLDITVAASVSVPTGSLDKSLVKVKITDTSETGDPFVEYTLAQLEAGPVNVPGVSGPLTTSAGSLDSASGGEQDIFDIQVKLELGAVTGAGANTGNFNLIFNGTNDAEVL